MHAEPCADLGKAFQGWCRLLQDDRQQPVWHKIWTNTMAPARAKKNVMRTASTPRVNQVLQTVVQCDARTAKAHECAAAVHDHARALCKHGQQQQRLHKPGHLGHDLGREMVGGGRAGLAGPFWKIKYSATPPLLTRARRSA